MQASWNQPVPPQPDANWGAQPPSQPETNWQQAYAGVPGQQPMPQPTPGQPMPGQQMPGQPMPGQQWGTPPGGPQPPKSNKKPLIIAAAIGAVVLLLVGVGFVVFSGGSKKSTPADAMQAYLEALAAGDAETVLALSADQPGNTEFLTEEILKKQVEHSPITDIRILSDSGVMSMGSVHVSVKFGETVSDETVQMKKTVDGWKVENGTVKLDNFDQNNPAAKTLTLFGQPVGDKAIYVFPGYLEWASSSENMEVEAKPVLLNALTGYFSLYSTDLTFKLSDSGKQAVKNAITAAIRSCTQSRAINPTGCPQRLNAWDAIENSVSWGMPDLSPLEVDDMSSYSTDVRFKGDLVYPVSYDTRRDGPQTGTQDEYVYGDVDVTTSPPTVSFS